MASVQYDKLVRDLIPDVIQRAGKFPVTDFIPAEEMPGALDLKLQEEVHEYLESHSTEEMADILEVLHGIAYHRGIPWEDIEAARLRKLAERGGFEKGLRLLEVRDPDSKES